MPVLLPSVNPGPPNPAVFADEVYNPTKSPVPAAAPPGIQGYVTRLIVSPFRDYLDTIYPRVPYTAPPPGVQGYILQLFRDRFTMQHYAGLAFFPAHLAPAINIQIAANAPSIDVETAWLPNNGKGQLYLQVSFNPPSIDLSAT